MRKDEDDNFQDMRSVEGIAKTIMFCLIAMIMITSFALPIIASVGERTVDLDNTGVRVSSFNEIGWEDAMDTFSPGAYMYIGSGIYNRMAHQCSSRYALSRSNNIH